MSLMRFALFLLVNALLFIRPAEFAPELYGLPVYEACILACLALSYPVVAAQLNVAALAARPVNACVLGLLPAIVLSHLSNAAPSAAFEEGLEFFKLLLYYFLLVGLVDSLPRLRLLMAALAGFAAVITSLSVAHYHHWVVVPRLQFIEEQGAENTGGLEGPLRRLGSTGLFADPNDMALLLVTATALALYQVLERRRWFWLGPIALFLHALTLTHSRGGLIALVVALGTTAFARFGRKALAGLPLALPLLLVLFAGRQTEISLSAGTGQSRLQLWAGGLWHFARRPAFGIGSGRYPDFLGHVAHNSFIHGFTELGFCGGALFLGAFYVAIASLVRLGGPGLPPLSPGLGAVRPYLLGALAGYAAGLMSLSCNYVIPTYTTIGLGAAYVRLAEAEYGVPVARVNGPLARRLAWVGLAFLASAALVLPFLIRLS